MSKKKKLRQKCQPSPGDTSDEDDTTQQTGKCCQHIIRAVNLTAIKKALKNNLDLGKCQQCAKDKVVINDDPAELTKTSSLCLMCASIGCNEKATGYHSHSHYLKPHSDCHSLVINTSTWTVWCYLCNDEILLETSKKIAEVVNFIKKHKSSEEKLSQPLATDINSNYKVEKLPVTQNNNKDLKQDEQKNKKGSTVENNLVKKRDLEVKKKIVKKIKGLTNLGNTCFFNAVMQNLIQTPWLYKCLEEHCNKNFIWKINAPTFGETGQSFDSEKMELLNIVLPPGEELTKSLLVFLQQINNGSNTNVVVNPNQLFGQLCKKAPQFQGYQQQDSHELLCHLFDAIKTEEIKRQKTGILQAFKLSEKIKRKNADDDTKQKVRGLRHHANHTFIDAIFGGKLLSTVLCEECGKNSQIFEPFIGLSLPVAEEKPLRPNMQKRSVSDKIVNGDDNNELRKEETKPNKRQQTKMKRQAKKFAKRQAKNVKRGILPSTSNSNEDLLTLKVEEEPEGNQTEADIEDNVDAEPITNQNSKDNLIVSNQNHISSYCDENQLKTDSIITSDNIKSEDEDDDITISMEYFASLTLDDRDATSIDQINDCTDYYLEPVAVEGDKVTDTNHFLNEQNCESKDSLLDVEHDRSPEDCSSISSVPDKEDVRNGSHDSGISNGEGEQKPTCKQSTSCIISSNSLSPRCHPASQECSILSSLYQFTARELLMGNNKFGCENCSQLRRKQAEKTSEDKAKTVYTNASKQLLIFSPPAVLILHLKRFQQSGVNLRKVNRHVDFPLLLDLAPFCSLHCKVLPQVPTNQKEILYSLYGVVEHSGRLTGGHYTAYIKSRNGTPNKASSFLSDRPIIDSDIDTLIKNLNDISSSNDEDKTAEQNVPEGQWYYVSDGHVSAATESQVLTSQGYLLFYERIL